jgi:hypothetical protein
VRAWWCRKCSFFFRESKRDIWIKCHCFTDTTALEVPVIQFRDIRGYHNIFTEESSVLEDDVVFDDSRLFE